MKQMELIRRRDGTETPLGGYEVKRVGMQWRVYKGPVCIWECWVGYDDAQQRANEYMYEQERIEAARK